MKRLSIALIGVGCLLFQSAQASAVFSENFNYPDGGLAGNVNPSSGNAWTAGGSQLTVVGNQLSVVNGAAQSTINELGTSINSGSVYYSFLLDCTAAPAGNSYLTSLNPGTSAPNGGSDALTVYIYSNATGFRLGLRTAGASATTTSSSSPFDLNTTYQVVMEYDFTSLQTYLWVNPGAGDEGSPLLNLAANGTVLSIDNVGFKSQSTAGASYLVDNLVIGTAWSDVVVAVPEPASISILGFGALGLVLGYRRMRR